MAESSSSALPGGVEWLPPSAAPHLLRAEVRATRRRWSCTPPAGEEHRIEPGPQARFDAHDDYLVPAGPGWSRASCTGRTARAPCSRPQADVIELRSARRRRRRRQPPRTAAVDGAAVGRSGGHRGRHRRLGGPPRGRSSRSWRGPRKPSRASAESERETRDAVLGGARRRAARSCQAARAAQADEACAAGRHRRGSSRPSAAARDGHGRRRAADAPRGDGGATWRPSSRRREGARGRGRRTPTRYSALAGAPRPRARGSPAGGGATTRRGVAPPRPTRADAART